MTMRNKEFPISSFSPAIQKMCRLPYHFRSFGDPTEPIDYIDRFSLTDDDIPALLEIAAWLGKDEGMNDCFNAPLHAWEALSYLDPLRVVPGMLDLLNRLNWDEADHVLDFISDQLAYPAMRSALEALETGNASLDAIPLCLAAMKEKERHLTTRMVLSWALHAMTNDYPERRLVHHRSEYHQILFDDLKELRIGCRDWYTSIVCELASEDMSPETKALLEKVCREGYVEPLRCWCNDSLKEDVGLDTENDPELVALYKKSERTRDVLRAFRNCNRTFPKQAMQQARELRDWIISNLIEEVHNATAYARYAVLSRAGTVQFAVHLLAEFQAKEALPEVLESLSLSDDNLYDYLYGEGTYESMPGIMYRLIGDDPDFYDKILRNPQEPVSLQYCLLNSLPYLVANDVISRETYGNWLRDYLEIAINADRDKADKKRFVTGLVCAIARVANPNNLSLIRTAYQRGLVDEFMISLENVKDYLKRPESPFERRLHLSKRDFANADVLSTWAWFEQDDDAYEDEDEDFLDDDDDDDEDGYDDEDYDDEWSSTSDFMSPAQREIMQKIAMEMFPSLGTLDADATTEDKLEAISRDMKASDVEVGRNDPCPCGRGRKYKVCCGKKK